MQVFRDRFEAGRKLAEALSHYAKRQDVTVLALPRGGVPVGSELANALELPLDVFLVKRLVAPGDDGLTLGAIATGGIRILNFSVVNGFDYTESEIEAIEAKARREIALADREYRADRGPLDVRGRVVILVDDGMVTGASMRAAVVALGSFGAAHVVVAVPVAPPGAKAVFGGLVDEFVALETPQRYRGAWEHFKSFEPVTDEAVRDLLAISRRTPALVG